MAATRSVRLHSLFRRHAVTTLLQINASLNNGNGQSSRLANQFVTAFQQSHPRTRIIKRDVAAANPVPHLDGERFGALSPRPKSGRPLSTQWWRIPTV